jgi:hypothetical protein
MMSVSFTARHVVSALDGLVEAERFGPNDWDLYLDGQFWSEGATWSQVRGFVRFVASMEV